LRTSTAPRETTSTAYVERVNLAVDHIVAHLAEPLRLADVARAARFSPFHFHRVFQALMGETPAEFVKRLRLDKAISAMSLHPPSRRLSLTRVALDCGFSSSSDFSRSFKQRFGASPRGLDLATWRREHRDELESVTARLAGKGRLKRIPSDRNPDGFKVKIRELPARTVAYIRVSDPYKGDAVIRAIRRLVAWAERRGLADGQWLGYQWENPELVALEKCRYYAAVEADRFTPSGEVGRFAFPPMTVAQVEVRGGVDLELRALQWLFGSWLPRSGYVPDDQPCFESWIGRPLAHGLEHFELHAQLPIRRE
jgi:AraC family transcriptional regulator